MKKACLLKSGPKLYLRNHDSHFRKNSVYSLFVLLLLARNWNDTLTAVRPYILVLKCQFFTVLEGV